MKSATVITALLLASSAVLIGQQPAPQRAFDVVSIKPSQSTVVGGGGLRFNPSGSFTSIQLMEKPQ